jgi:hypothetical protein
LLDWDEAAYVQVVRESIANSGVAAPIIQGAPRD